jgi:hypothetical protein
LTPSHLSIDYSPRKTKQNSKNEINCNGFMTAPSVKLKDNNFDSNNLSSANNPGEVNKADVI